MTHTIVRFCEWWNGIATRNERLQFAKQQADQRGVVWSAPEVESGVHTNPNDLPQGRKCSRVWFNRIRLGWCQPALLLSSIWTGKSEFLSCQLEISTRTHPEIGYLTRKVGGTSPTLTSKSNMAAPWISSSKVIYWHWHIKSTITVPKVLSVDSRYQVQKGFFPSLLNWNAVSLDVMSFPAPTSDLRGKWNAPAGALDPKTPDRLNNNGWWALRLEI